LLKISWQMLHNFCKNKALFAYNEALSSALGRYK